MSIVTQTGDKVWIVDDCADRIMQAEIANELNDDLLDCLVMQYVSEMTRPDVIHVARPADEVFYTRDSALDWMVDRYRTRVSQTSYNYQFAQEHCKEIYERDRNSEHVILKEDSDG